MNQANIAVIGAGLAGLACARRLHASGHRVVVLDKGRSPGGRLATRRAEGVSFDHGAQYFTAREQVFRDWLGEARQAGAVAGWAPRWPGGEQETAELHVGAPGMSSIARQLAQGLELRPETRITQMMRIEQAWTLTDDRGGGIAGFDFVVLALPAPQAASLLPQGSPLAAPLGGRMMAPCWSVMAAFAEPLQVPVDASWIDDPVLPWLARNSSKPGRTGLDAWVLHAAADWSRAELESDPARIREALLARMAVRLDISLPAPVHVDVHRWRHARIENPLGEPFVADFAAGLAACGGWCLDARVEAAFLSGDALGRELAVRL